jgi:hypothetical protein
MIVSSGVTDNDASSIAPGRFGKHSRGDAGTIAA